MGLLNIFKKKQVPGKVARNLNEKLVCQCNTDKHHKEYTDTNGEVILECTKCKRFLKFPA